MHVRTWGLGGPLRDRCFNAQLLKLKRRHRWFPVIALSQTAAADIAICGGTHPGFLAAMEREPGWKDRLAIALERQHLQSARWVVAHSGLMASQVHQYYGVDRSRIKVFYPPVDTQRFSPVTSEQRLALKKKLGLPEDRCVFLLASTGHARKGLDLLVQALGHSELPVQLVVVGRPVDVEAPNLTYLGYRSDIEDVYRAVDCTVMASRYEPFGLVGVETVLCGTPLLGAEGMGCMEVLQDDAVVPFNLVTHAGPGSLDNGIANMLQRWRSGVARVTQPLASLSYDPSVESHLSVLEGLVQQMLQERQEGLGA